MDTQKIIPVIMSGGAGSRLWPLSRQAMPKQLLPLVTDMTMAQETVLRVSSPLFEDPVFICNSLHATPITAQMNAINKSVGAIITEPMGRNTAPVAVIAALHAQQTHPNALVLLAPADHDVRDPDAFKSAVKDALPAVLEGKLITFGINPDRPETGYGYIQMGRLIHPGVHDVQTFREKPNDDMARAYIESGYNALNAGIYLYSPEAFLSEIEKFEPEILRCAKDAYAQSSHDGKIIHLDPDEFANCPSQSIDYAVMEKTDKAAVVPCNIGWSDIGSFASLHEVTRDNGGNATHGDVIEIDTTNSLIHTDGPLITTVGVNNLAVVVHEGRVLVANLDAAQDVKKIVEALKTQNRTQDL